MTVIWSQTARADLARIFEFNAARSENWAARVDARLIARAEALAHASSGGRSLGSGFRSASVSDIQYVIVYQLENELVTITSIYSTRENRDYR